MCLCVRKLCGCEKAMSEVHLYIIGIRVNTSCFLDAFHVPTMINLMSY